MSTPLEFDTEILDGGTCALWLRGSADIANHDALKAQLAKVASAPQLRVVIDLRGLSFITSLAIGEMIALHKSKKAAGGKVVVCSPNDYVKSVLVQSRFGTVVTISPTLEEAVETVKG